MFFGAVAIAQVPIADDASATRVSVTGVVGTGVVDSVAVTTGQSLAVTGVQAVCTHGVVAVNTGTGAVINAGASVGTTGLGTVSVIAGTGVTVNITGFEATATLNGAVIVTGSSLVVAASFPTVMSLGTVIQRTTANIAVSSPPMNGIVGVDTSVTGSAIVTLTGVQASGEVGNVILWGDIVPSVDQIWTPIAA